MTLSEALARTVLLAKTALEDGTPDDAVLDALTSTTVVLVADGPTISTHAGQSAFVTAALLMARSGHDVWLQAPDINLIGCQAPLKPGKLISSLLEIGKDLLPSREFHIGSPSSPVDVAILLGATEGTANAELVQRVTWTPWSGAIDLAETQGAGSSTEWPFGGMTAGALAAGEVFKSAMRRLAPHARVPRIFAKQFAPSESARIQIAREETAWLSNLGDFDVISGGAISNSVLYALLRIPGLVGSCRVFDDDRSDTSNLNRNMLLRRSRLRNHKVQDLATYGNGLAIHPEPVRFVGQADGLVLAKNILVGVDHIESRWRVQECSPAWLGVGATDNFLVQVSTHADILPCVGCLHPEAFQGGGDIPTAAFVSFWAGLLLASEFIERMNGSALAAAEQLSELTALRPESFRLGPVSPRADCPVGCLASAQV